MEQKSTLYFHSLPPPSSCPAFGFILLLFSLEFRRARPTSTRKKNLSSARASTRFPPETYGRTLPSDSLPVQLRVCPSHRDDHFFLFLPFFPSIYLLVCVCVFTDSIVCFVSNNKTIQISKIPVPWILLIGERSY